MRGGARCQSLQIIWMYTSAPIFAGDFGCAQWQPLAVLALDSCMVLKLS
jgi:hypothetical protein